MLRQIRFVGFAALLLLGGFYGIRSAEVYFLKRDLNDLAAQQASAEAERQQLAEVAAARDAVVSGKTLASQLLRGEISWSNQMLRLSEAVPFGFTLSSFSGSASGGDVAGISGTISFAATAKDFIPAEAWLVRIAAQEGWTNGWVSSISAGEGGFAVSGSFDLTPAAISARGGGPA